MSTRYFTAATQHDNLVWFMSEPHVQLHLVIYFNQTCYVLDDVTGMVHPDNKKCIVLRCQVLEQRISG